MDSAETTLRAAGEASTAGRLEQFNRRWGERRRALSRWSAAPWWGRGMVISPELRGWVNSFLPPEDFRRDLRLLAEDYFRGNADLIPGSLLEGAPEFLSLPDLWATLEDGTAGLTSFRPEQLLELWCNLADPSRMGTATGRYGRQLAALADIASAPVHGGGSVPLTLLDLGCGIGLGTLEAVSLCARVHPSAAVRATGVTAEGLEVWMAAHRCLPHDRQRQREFEVFQDIPEGAVQFRQGLAETYADGYRYGIILCNGLAGGRFLNTLSAVRRFLDNLQALLAPGGTVLMSNHFHEGSRRDVDTLLRIAAADGWIVRGDWHDTVMTPGWAP